MLNSLQLGLEKNLHFPGPVLDWTIQGFGVLLVVLSCVEIVSFSGLCRDMLRNLIPPYCPLKSVSVIRGETATTMLGELHLTWYKSVHL